MTLDEVKAFFGFRHDKQVADRYGITKSAVSRWRKNGEIPEGRQAAIQIDSDNQLKVDEKHLVGMGK